MRASSSNPRSCRRSDVFVLGREGLVPGLLVDVLETVLVDVLEAESDGEFGATGVWQPRCSASGTLRTPNRSHPCECSFTEAELDTTSHDDRLLSSMTGVRMDPSC